MTVAMVPLSPSVEIYAFRMHTPSTVPLRQRTER